jgi:hypothetical protein
VRRLVIIAVAATQLASFPALAAPPQRFWNAPAVLHDRAFGPVDVVSDGRLAVAGTTNFDGKVEVIEQLTPGGPWGHPRALSQTRVGGALQLAAGPRGGPVLAVWALGPPGGVQAAVRRDGVWEEPVTLAAAGDVLDIEVAMDVTGRAMASWAVRAIDFSIALNARSFDPVTGWGPALPAVPAGFAIPSVALSGDGTAHAVWENYEAGASVIHHAELAQGSERWVTSGPLGTGRLPRVAVTSDGLQAVTWVRDDRLLARLRQPLQLWGPEVVLGTINTFGAHATVATDGGRIVAVWSSGPDGPVTAAASTPGASVQWNAPRVLSRRQVYLGGLIRVDEHDDGVVAVWARETNGAGRVVQAATLAAGDEEWSVAKDVSELGFDLNSVAVAGRGRGKALVVWSGSRVDAARPRGRLSVAEESPRPIKKTPVTLRVTRLTSGPPAIVGTRIRLNGALSRFVEGERLELQQRVGGRFRRTSQVVVTGRGAVFPVRLLRPGVASFRVVYRDRGKRRVTPPLRVSVRRAKHPTVPVGQSPYGIALGSDAVWVLVANDQDTAWSLVRIDPRTNRVSRRYALPERPWTVIAAAGKTWVPLDAGMLEIGPGYRKLHPQVKGRLAARASGQGLVLMRFTERRLVPPSGPLYGTFPCADVSFVKVALPSLRVSPEVPTGRGSCGEDNPTSFVNMAVRNGTLWILGYEHGGDGPLDAFDLSMGRRIATRYARAGAGPVITPAGDSWTAATAAPELGKTVAATDVPETVSPLPRDFERRQKVKHPIFKDLAFGRGLVWAVVGDVLDESSTGWLVGVDPTTNRISRALVPVGRGPAALETGFGSVWIVNRYDGTVIRLPM